MTKIYQPAKLIILVILGVSCFQWIPHSNEGANSPGWAEELTGLPLCFVPNEGQFSSNVRFLAEVNGQRVALGDGGIELFRYGSEASLQMRFLERNQDTQPRGGEKAEGKVHYLLGNDSSRWRPGLPTYKTVTYADVYNNVDVSYRGRGRELESTFTIEPGGRISDIRIRCETADSVRLDGEGNLIWDSPVGTFKESRPIGYQMKNGSRHDVRVRYWLERDSKTYGFRLEDRHDLALPLIIDPIMGFSSYLGGSAHDRALAMTVDELGQLYITGQTFSTDFPTKSALSTSPGGNGDAFVTKIGADGATLIYSTYLGGSNEDSGRAIAVDGSGNVYLTGLTFSSDFPVASAFRSTNFGGGDAFVTKLTATGDSLSYSTFLGGTQLDVAKGISVDSGGSAYVVGQTFSPSFPIMSPIQNLLRGVLDGFITKLAASGQALIYSSYIGGSDVDGANGVAVDGSGQAYITGFTSSLNFPTASPIQSTNAGEMDAFITKISTDGAGFVFSTYLGGSDDEEGNALIVTESDQVHVTGFTRSADFPTGGGAFQSAIGGGVDAFLTILDLPGSSISLSTYLGGSGQDEGVAVARDNLGQLYVAGTTSSIDFPLANALQTALLGNTDAFLSQFFAGGQGPLFSTYVGGSSDDSAAGMIVDTAGRIYIAGETRSVDFPRVLPLQSMFGGGISDGFFLRIDPTEPNFVTTLFFPRLVTSDGNNNGGDASEFTGMAAANLSPVDAILKFTAYDTAGKLIRGSGINNPAQEFLASKNQLAKVDFEIFGTGLGMANPVGWFQLESTAPETVGFFLIFDSALSFLDGADVSTGSLSDFILPEIEDEGFTQLHIANPNPNSVTATLELMQADGSPCSSVTRQIAANGVLVGTVDSLYPEVGQLRGDMYIRGMSSNAVVPFENLGKWGAYVEGLNGQNRGQGAKIVYSPQYVVGGPWRTTISIVNLENVATNLLMRFIDDSGMIVSTRFGEISSDGKLQITAQDFFVNPDPDNLSQGYVQITSDTRIGGSVVFGDPARSIFSSALPLVSNVMTTSLFSQVASDSTFFTGLAVLNQGKVDTNFDLEVFDALGNLVGSTNVPLSAGHRISQLLTQYLPTLPGMSAGYFRITAPRGLLSFALFGTRTLTVLSAVPPQALP